VRPTPSLRTFEGQLNRKERQESKGVQCLSSMTLFIQRVNIAHIAMSRFSLRPLRLCGSKCRI
jgi:hypothetical protein